MISLHRVDRARGVRKHFLANNWDCILFCTGLWTTPYMSTFICQWNWNWPGNRNPWPHRKSHLPHGEWRLQFSFGGRVGRGCYLWPGYPDTQAIPCQSKIERKVKPYRFFFKVLQVNIFLGTKAPHWLLEGWDWSEKGETVPLNKSELLHCKTRTQDLNRSRCFVAKPRILSPINLALLVFSCPRSCLYPLVLLLGFFLIKFLV